MDELIKTKIITFENGKQCIISGQSSNRTKVEVQGNPTIAEIEVDMTRETLDNMKSKIGTHFIKFDTMSQSVSMVPKDQELPMVDKQTPKQDEGVI